MEPLPLFVSTKSSTNLFKLLQPPFESSQQARDENSPSMCIIHLHLVPCRSHVARCVSTIVMFVEKSPRFLDTPVLRSKRESARREFSNVSKTSAGCKMSKQLSKPSTFRDSRSSRNRMGFNK